MISLLFILLTIHGTEGRAQCTVNPTLMSHFPNLLSPYAGHCVFAWPSSSLSVAAGITQSQPRNIQLVPVKTIHLHPNFDSVCSHDVYWENNIAVLEFSEELIWESTIAAVPLIDGGYDWNLREICGLFRWDDDSVDGIKLLTLRQSQVIGMAADECRALNVHLSENEKCLRSQAQPPFLSEGDYGAPVMCGNVAVGITIRGGENEYNPPVSLSIYPYLQFIASILNVNINNPRTFPYYVVIFYNGIPRCGGSIIDSTHILTAAHYVPDTTRETLTVLPGRSEFFVDELHPWEFSLVDHIQSHPDYEQIGSIDGQAILGNDIAVLTLRAPLAWSDTINAIALADNFPVEKVCQVLRWSRTTTRQGGKLMKSLWSSVRIRDYEPYGGMSSVPPSKEFCVVNAYSLPIAAQGDSGSPIICDGQFIMGILSGHTFSNRLPWGPFQAICYSTIFTYRKFISDAVANRI